MGVRGSNQTKIASYGGWWTLSWRRQRSLNLALELADCCACGEAANVARRLGSSCCGQGGGAEDAGERRRHEAAVSIVGLFFSFGMVSTAAVARASYLEFWIDDGLGLCGTLALKNLACLDRWIGIQWMEAVDFTASCVCSVRGLLPRWFWGFFLFRKKVVCKHDVHHLPCSTDQMQATCLYLNQTNSS